MTLSTVNLERFNALTSPELQEALTRCCGSHRWVEAMMAQHPYADVETLFRAAEDNWFSLSKEDWLEAFTHHPKIGDLDSLRAKFANTRDWAEGEQSGVESAAEEMIQALAAGNQEYEARFGYIFIVCATGKSAEEMLSLLQGRLNNDPDTELRIAAGEQLKITRIRLEKL
jgi:2-oxo-4-hydroxy-4-carboxy-5-ureidoimidazoline decarboxylase